MKTNGRLLIKCIWLFALLLNSFLIFAGSPQLIWHQAYGEPNYQQPALVTAIDNYDNYFVAGYVYFGTYGNVLVNRYDGVGNLKWNRMYSNGYPSANSDRPVALFPNNNAGVTVVGYVNKSAVLTHIYTYDGAGNIAADNFLGDTTAGNKTYPVAVIYDGASSYYMVGKVNSVPSVFRCDNGGHIIWAVPLHNNFNTEVGSINFDPNDNIVVAVTDSNSAQVLVRRYDKNTGAALPGFNTHLSSLPVNDNFIKTQVDGGSNIFLASTTLDTSGRMQWVVNKFDTTGALLWSTTCNSAKGYSNTINSFLLDHLGDIIISGPFKNDTGTWQFGAVYKVASDTGGVLWSYNDTLFLVNNATAKVDLFNFVYLGVTKTPSAISPYYTEFSFTQLSPDSGIAQWNRSFDNNLNNTNLLTQVNNFGDIFLASTTTTDTSSEWFVGRVGNDAGDVIGTGINSVKTNANGLEVYPNPFGTSTTVSFTASQAEAMVLSIYNVTGQLLQQQNIQGVAGNNKAGFNTSLPAGIYLLKLQGGDGTSVTRIVIY